MKDTKSTSGYVFTLSGAVVSWKSSKQTCISKSTMEYEFIALDKAGECVATSQPDPTRLADPNRKPEDGRPKPLIKSL